MLMLMPMLLAFPETGNPAVMSDLTKMLAQAQAVQSRLQAMQAELEKLTVTASSGGGMVTVTADGKGQVRSIKIDPSVVNAADVEMLEDLVLAAVTEAQRKATAAAAEEMQKATGGLSFPFKLPF
jgi:DNA-binding YbaB/EbfC family protein